MPVKRCGLTALELIVVTVIILVVAGLVTSVSLKGIGNAKRKVCLSNLRSLAIAQMSYAADHDDFLPPYSWHGRNERVKDFKAATAPYGFKGDQWYCPLDQHARTTYRGEFGDHSETSYIFNVLVLRKNTANGVPVVRLSSIAKPSDTIWFADQGRSVKIENEWEYVGNHGTDSNGVYFDGHAKNFADPLAVAPPTPD